MFIRVVFCLILLVQGCVATSASQTQAAGLSALTASDLAEAIRTGDTTSEQAVTAYLARIEQYDRQGPKLQSILALNSNAVAEARKLDAEARAGRFRGALHGVPVVVKDNIETRELPTTAGSLALLNNNTERDAPITARLREQGAIILGKTNLTEWANFRSGRAVAGWSGVGGQTRNPYSLDRTPCGSSAGSAVAIAARLAPLALGTETNGSIICPAAVNGAVGFKPTLGLLSRTHIVPLAPSQDTAGPITRTVRDAALMLTIMAGRDANDPMTDDADRRRQDYVQMLDRNIDGMRIGVFRWAEGKNTAVSAIFNEALAALEERGAVLVDITEFNPDPVLWETGDTMLKREFKSSLNDYLQTAAADVDVKSLNDVIAFNDRHAERELALFDQSIFIEAQSAGGVDDPQHIANVNALKKAAGENGIDRLLAEHSVEVLLMPAARPAHVMDTLYTNNGPRERIGAGWLAAIAGYPILTVPMGAHRELPVGLAIMGTAWDDETVLAVGHAYEQSAGHEMTPSFRAGPFDSPSTAALMQPYRAD